jgi:hypothetical protein
MLETLHSIVNKFNFQQPMLLAEQAKKGDFLGVSFVYQITYNVNNVNK